MLKTPPVPPVSIPSSTQTGKDELMTRAEGLGILAVVLMAIALVIGIVNGRSGVELGIYVALLVLFIGLNGRLAWKRRHGAA
ncbi:hypothetical protein RER_22440 [Rhodococcus erythropolis PR4]|uniref:Uncharacterized protein n=3 Tax=root TaxID=1 RepID=C0ZX67_RHOE4|nr:hypothetical protein RER_22440 [Rhodococcus erythropolis PR4]